MGKVFNRNCCVPGCKSRKGVDPTLHFHKFPSANSKKVTIVNYFGIPDNIDRRKAWILKLKLGKPVSKAMLVCSKHFNLEDYLAEGICKIAPKLKPTSVPSMNLPQSSIDVQKSEDVRRKDRYERRQELRDQNISTTKVESAASTPTAMEFCTEATPELLTEDLINKNNLSEEEINCVNTLLQLMQSDSTENQNKLDVSTYDKSVQVCSGDLILHFCSTIQTEKQLNSLTGIGSFKLLDALVKLTIKFYPDNRPHSHTLSVKDRIILVLMKLKLSLSLIVISFLFKISSSTCRLIFDDFIDKLSNVLRSCITFPSIDEVRKNIPACFKEFQSVRIVLDCTEIPVQRPKCLCCRIRTYSHYKGNHTVKIMTGVSPAGLITFLSKAYGGRSSDKAIFEQSGLIEKLIPHIDSIMVDKGFLIDKMCEEYFIKILRPAFLRKKKQFSEDEAKKNLLISRARVHVERLNQRIKVFKIFNNPLPWNMVKNIDDIFTVIVGIVNLQKPVLKDDKF